MSFYEDLIVIISIDLASGSAPDRWQAIIWISDDIGHPHMYQSLGQK